MRVKIIRSRITEFSHSKQLLRKKQEHQENCLANGLSSNRQVILSQETVGPSKTKSRKEILYEKKDGRLDSDS